MGRLHPSPERMPHSASAGSIGKSPMKEHVVSSRDCLTELVEEGCADGSGAEGPRGDDGEDSVNNSSQDLAKGGGLAH